MKRIGSDRLGQTGISDAARAPTPTSEARHPGDLALFNEFRFQAHRAESIDFAINIVIALD